jgi:hypothetical protein
VFTSGGISYVWVVNFRGQMAVRLTLSCSSLLSLSSSILQCFEQGAFAKPLAWFEPSKSLLGGSATVSPATMALDDGAPEVADIVISWMVVKERVRMHAVRTAPRPRNGLQVGRF